MAPMPPYARAASIRAQLDRLLDNAAAPAPPPSIPGSDQLQPSTVEPQSAPEPQRIQRPKKRRPRSTAAARVKAKMRASKLPSSKEDQAESSFDRHRRKCLVCNHPQREAIEELFINWHSPRALVGEFGIHPRLDWPSVYRHARATGLYAKRRNNLRAVFDLVLEQASGIAPTAQGLVAVVRGYSCLTDTNQWIEPEKRVHVINHLYRHDLPAAADAPACADEGKSASNASTGLSNRNTTELESPPTHT
jgi:hypothetical protein